MTRACRRAAIAALATFTVLFIVTSAARADTHTMNSKQKIHLNGVGMEPVSVFCTMALEVEIEDEFELPLDEIGEITEGALVDCGGCGCEPQGGELLLEDPWALGDGVPLGRLPRPTGILAVIEEFMIFVDTARVDCLYTGEVGMLLPLVTLINNDYGAVEAVLLANALDAHFLSDPMCPDTASVSGEFTLIPLMLIE